MFDLTYQTKSLSWSFCHYLIGIILKSKGSSKKTSTFLVIYFEDLALIQSKNEGGIGCRYRIEHKNIYFLNIMKLLYLWMHQIEFDI